MSHPSASVRCELCLNAFHNSYAMSSIPNAAMPSVSKEEQRLAGRAFRSGALAGGDAASGGAAAAASAHIVAPFDGAEFKRELIAELNRIRTSPRAFADELEQLLASPTAWDGDKRFAHPRSRSATKLALSEGKAAVKDAVAFFRDLEPRKALEQTALLDGVAQRLAADSKQTVEARVRLQIWLSTVCV